MKASTMDLRNVWAERSKNVQLKRNTKNVQLKRDEYTHLRKPQKRIKNSNNAIISILPLSFHQQKELFEAPGEIQIQ